MKTRFARRTIVWTTAIALLGVLVLAAPAGADSTRTKGTGRHFFTSWTEFDREDVLGLPGNVHIGFLGGWKDQYGTYTFGHVTDLECPPGVSPWDGHHIAETIVAEAVQVAEGAAEKAIDAIVSSGAKAIDANVVIDAVKAELAEEVPEVIEDEVPTCKYVQDRFLDGTDTLSFTVDTKKGVAQVTGTVTVTGGHGNGHGEPGPVLGRPPVNLTITGGDWWKYESSWKSWGENFQYSDWRKGTDFYGGTVTGSIGAMGFDDDPDDQSHGGFGDFEYRTVERIRN